MEDYTQIILFALLALFSLISNLLNRRKKQQAETRKSREQVEEESGRREGSKPRRRPEVDSPDEPETRNRREEPEEEPSTFKQILRELTGESVMERRVQEQGQAQEEVEDDYEHPFAERKPKGTRQKQEDQGDSFSRSIQPAEGSRRSISDKIDLDQDISSKRLEVKKVKSGKKKKNTAASIGKSLRNAESTRKAIILSEIIRPRHF